MVDHLILLREVVFEIDTLFILQNYSFFLNDLFPLKFIFLFFIVRSEPQQRRHVNRTSAPILHMGQLDMRFHFILCLEGNIALGFTFVVGAYVMRFCEVLLEGRVVRIVHVFELVVAQVTRQMHPLQMIQEN